MNITVDFDNTLTIPLFMKSGQYKKTLVPDMRVIGKLKELHRQGNKISLVTFRPRSKIGEVHNFLTHYQVPVETIVYTDGRSKLPYLKKLNSQMHIDDDVQTLQDCKNDGIEPRLIFRGFHRGTDAEQLFAEF